VSAVAESARVNLFLADFANVDAIGKINCLGVGWQATGIDPATGNTAPQTVVLLVDVPPAHIGETYAMEVALYDDANELVQVPGPIGELQALRIGQPVQVGRSVVPGVAAAGWSHFQLVIHFAVGLPLAPGREYTWRARIDGDTGYAWSTSFHVAAAPVGPMIG